MRIILLFRHFDEEVVLVAHVAAFVWGASDISYIFVYVFKLTTAFNVAVIISFDRNEALGMLIQWWPCRIL